MSDLRFLKSEFEKGRLAKKDYIEQMFQLHRSLFDFSHFIADTDISHIELADHRVIMTFRDSGIKFICADNDMRLAPFDTLNFGSYERDELLMQGKMIREGDTILDIGANFGWYAMMIAKMHPHSRVHSFEPIQTSFNYLNDNIKLNALGNISTYNFGFSDHPGKEVFYFDPSLSVNASLANLSDSDDISHITCQLDTVDHFTASNGLKADFIKCDVEGAELLVFRGGSATIANDKPVVFSEMLRKWSARFDYHPNDIIAFFRDLGYSCYTTENGFLRYFDTVGEETKETNFFFLHDLKHREIVYKHCLAKE